METKLENTRMATTRKQKEPHHYSKAGLLARGWTAGSITRWLGEPDSYADNPHPGGADILLYAIRRVSRAEARKDWKAWREQMDKRRAAHPDSGAKALETKLRNIQAFVDSITITLPTLSDSELLGKAIENYNAIHSQDRQPKYADKTDSPEFLRRIQQNYLRHTQCEYEQHLNAIAGRTGCESAYQQIRDKVETAINKQYPHLI